MDALLIIAALIVGCVIAAVIALALLLGMVIVWPLSLILIILGGFVFGGIGALAGGAISGIVGLCIVQQ